MPKGLRNSFQTGHELDYARKVTERHPQSSAVLAVSCHFCLKFGRESKPGAKHKRTNNMQVFNVPFCTDLYKKHHSNAHPGKWQRYITSRLKASIRDQKTFFIDTLQNIPPESAVAITLSVSMLFAGLYTGIIDFVATRYFNNQSCTEASPPVLPRGPAAICTSDLWECFWSHRVWLEKAVWTTAEINRDEKNHRILRQGANREASFMDMYERCFDVNTTLERVGHCANVVSTSCRYMLAASRPCF